MKCTFCKGTGEYNYLEIPNIRVFGMTVEEIIRMRYFAEMHGYKVEEEKETPKAEGFYGGAHEV